MKTQTGYSITQPTAKQFLAAVIHNHGAKVTLPLDPEDDQGAIVWHTNWKTHLTLWPRGSPAKTQTVDHPYLRCSHGTP